MEIIGKVIGIIISTFLCIWFMKFMQRNKFLNAITTILAIVFFWSIFNYQYEDEDMYICSIIFVLAKLIVEIVKFIKTKRSGVRLQMSHGMRVLLTIILSFVAIAFICTGILIPLAYGVKEIIKILWKDE